MPGNHDWKSVLVFTLGGCLQATCGVSFMLHCEENRRVMLFGCIHVKGWKKHIKSMKMHRTFWQEVGRGGWLSDHSVIWAGSLFFF